MICVEVNKLYTLKLEYIDVQKHCRLLVWKRISSNIHALLYLVATALFSTSNHSAQKFNSIPLYQNLLPLQIYKDCSISFQITQEIANLSAIPEHGDLISPSRAILPSVPQTG